MTPTILADNRFTDGTITATGVTDDSRLYIIDGRPYTWLQVPSAGTKHIVVDCGSVKQANALGVIGHNFASAAASISLSGSNDGSSWTTYVGPVVPTSDKALLRTFTQASARYWRLTINSPTVAPMVAVVMVGSRIDFPYPPDAGFVPFSETVEVDSNDSKTGNPLGVVVRFFPVAIKPNFSNIDREWIETIYRPFRENYSRFRKYFFWSWDLETYPDQVFYVQDIGTYAPDVSTLAFYNKLALDFKGVMENPTVTVAALPPTTTTTPAPGTTTTTTAAPNIAPTSTIVISNVQE